MNCIAFDLGGSSGKMVLGSFDGNSLSMETLHRFDNGPISMHNSLYWNFHGIYENLLTGVMKATSQGFEVKSLGIDTFCNDFGFVDKNGTLLSQVHCYRDARTKTHQDTIYNRISKERLHSITGNQNALFNTFMQLASLSIEEKDYFFKNGNKMLFLADLLGFMLTGMKWTEYSVASVSQMMDYNTSDWSEEILNSFCIPKSMFSPIVFAGGAEAQVCPEIGNKISNPTLTVIPACAHDTASAVTALPTNEKNVAFISSGTWSLIGTELDTPIVNESTFLENFALEGGADGSKRLLKNVMGLWLVQECKQNFALHQNQYTYAELEDLARCETPFRSLIDPDHDAFYSPGDMPAKIAKLCTETNQPIPETPGQIVRCIIESLALKYRWVLEQLEIITQKNIQKVYIIGGGAKDGFLNECTANASQKVVYAGPYEAALCGNLMVQLISHGEIADISQGREIMSNFVSSTVYEPQNVSVWDDQYDRFKQLFLK